MDLFDRIADRQRTANLFILIWNILLLDNSNMRVKRNVSFFT